jgi:hypothetical protein
MHSTNHLDVIGYIDNNNITNNTIKSSGWCMKRTFECNSLRVLCDNNMIIYPTIVKRSDVANFYNVDNELSCGWEFEAPLPCVLQTEFEDGWVSVFNFSKFYIPNHFSIKKTIPSLIVVDNFYEKPDEVREFALKCDFKSNPLYYKGKRTHETYKFNGLKERFEEIINCKITNWNKYETNCCFQYCTEEDKLVYHCDNQEYAGVLFLTPDAPVETGTCLLRSKHTKKMKVSIEEESIVFAKGFLDSSEFDFVDKVGNVYNRLVLFDSRCIHAASEYFGDSLENSRLFQLFFFDLQK